MVLIVDMSDSVCALSETAVCDNWMDVKRFLASIVMKMSKSPSQTQVALIMYGSRAQVGFTLNRSVETSRLFAPASHFPVVLHVNSNSENIHFDLSEQKIAMENSGDT